MAKRALLSRSPFSITKGEFKTDTPPKAEGAAVASSHRFFYVGRGALELLRINRKLSSSRSKTRFLRNSRAKKYPIRIPVAELNR
jgi:hypothetical protein